MYLGELDDYRAELGMLIADMLEEEDMDECISLLQGEAGSDLDSDTSALSN